jgi:hypothetical protein
LYIKINVLLADGPVYCMFTLHKIHKIAKKTKGKYKYVKKYWGAGVRNHLYCNDLPLGSRYYQYGISFFGTNDRKLCHSQQCSDLSYTAP